MLNLYSINHIVALRYNIRYFTDILNAEWKETIAEIEVLGSADKKV